MSQNLSNADLAESERSPQAVARRDLARVDGAIDRTLRFFRAAFVPGDTYHPSQLRWPSAIEVAEGRTRVRPNEGGYWIGELEGDTTVGSDYILFLSFLDADAHHEKIQSLARHILREQSPSGGWNLYHGGPDEISASVKAYFALKLAGFSPDDERLLRAREAILGMGGVEQANSYTKIYLSFLNQFDWDEIPAIPPEIILLPRFFYFNVYEISYWSRAILIPLSILYAKKPQGKVHPEITLEEIFRGGDENEPASKSPANGKRNGNGNGNGKKRGNGIRGRFQLDPNLLSWRNFFTLTDRILRLIEKTPLKPLRSIALKKAEDWVVKRSEDSDGLGGIFPSMVNSVLALQSLGHDVDHPAIVKNLEKVRELEVEEDGATRLQPCLSPVWDTALILNALVEAGCSPSAPEVAEATRWLLTKEVRKPGDWQLRVRDAETSGWPFQFRNEFYPDIDDTAAVVLALDRCDPRAVDGLGETISRAVHWVVRMQCTNGGWAAFDADIDHQVFNHVPYADHNAMLDPACADITGRVLEMLGRFPHLHDEPEVRTSIERGVTFLLEEQEDDGSWYARWGVNYVYGTWQTLKGLMAVGTDPKSAPIRRAVSWLKSTQQPSGGWGESCDSYKDAALKGKGEPTASQTAWAVMGLIAAGEIESPEVERGIAFLLDSQNEDGTWDEPHFTGTGFPDVYYLRYHYYRVTFPLFALGYYKNACTGKTFRGVPGKTVALPKRRAARSPAP